MTDVPGVLSDYETQNILDGNLPPSTVPGVAPPSPTDPRSNVQQAEDALPKPIGPPVEKLEHSIYTMYVRPFGTYTPAEAQAGAEEKLKSDQEKLVEAQQRATKQYADYQKIKQAYPAFAPNYVLPEHLVADAAAEVKRSRDRLEGKAPKLTQTPWLNMLDSAVQGGAGVFVGAAQAPLIANELLSGEKSQYRQALDSWEKNVLLKEYPGDPERAKEFMTTLGQAAGSMTAFVVGTAALGWVGAPEWVGSAGLGALSQATSQVQDAEQFGATTAQKWLAFISGLGIGATEAVPIDRAFKRLSEASGGGLISILKRTAATSLEEFLQEFGQNFGSDLIAKVGLPSTLGLPSIPGYDPNRKFDWASYAEQGLAGALVGGGLHGVTELGQKALGTNKEPPAPPDQPTKESALRAFSEAQARVERTLSAAEAQPTEPFFERRGLMSSVPQGAIVTPMGRTVASEQHLTPGEREMMGLPPAPAPAEIPLLRELGERADALPVISHQVTQSPQFQNWFRDSKVKDDKGAPLVVYHGTNADFRAFDRSRLGQESGAPSAKMAFFFARNPDVASSYADTRNPYRDTKLGKLLAKLTGGHYEKFNEEVLRQIGRPSVYRQGGNVIPAFLSVQNPKIVDFGKKDYREKSYAQILAEAKAAGHDGVIFRDTSDPGYTGAEGSADITDIYAVFEPTQVKSIWGTDFDPNSENIDELRAHAEGLLPEGQRRPQAYTGKLTERKQDGSHSAEVSTRFPTAVSRTEDPITERLQPDLKTAKSDPAAFEHNIDLVRNYSNLTPEEASGTAAQVAENFIQHVVNNLLWLHDRFPKPLRERASSWYDGANNIARDWAKRYQLPDRVIAGVMAALSPQMDWFKNVSLAERVLDVMTQQQDTAFGPAMMAKAKQIFSNPKFAARLAALEGKTLAELPTIELKAMYIRIFDETFHDRSYRIVTPEGNFVDYVRKADGGTSTLGWATSLGDIGKAVAIIMNPDPQAISAMLGGAHKVRSFYNNILAPNSASGDVTIDTHAVAAGLLKPLSGTSREVSHSMGTWAGQGEANSTTSNITGMNGLYGLYAEAYRRAAKRRKILPRQMQSITWEAVRGLYTAGFKGQQANKDAIDQLWQDYHDGKTTLAETRKLLESTAGGIHDPSWVGSDTRRAKAGGYSSYQGGLPGAGISGRGARPAAGGAGGAAAAGAAAGERGSDLSGAVDELVTAGRPDFAIASAAERVLEAFKRLGSGRVSEGLRRPVWTVRGGRRGTGEGIPVRHEINPAAAQVFSDMGVATPPVMELPLGAQSAGQFHSSISAAKSGNAFAAAMHVYEPGEYAQMRLFLTEDGSAGFAINNNELVSVFSIGTHKGVGFSLVKLATEMGAERLDCFDTVLPALYSGMGFRAAARVLWDEQFKPDNWSKSTFAAYNNGEPAVVHMVWDPDNAHVYDRDEAQAATYDQASDLTRRWANRIAGREEDSDEFGVWHGSPHVFTKFSLSAIGSGEGAQTYGQGLYFAEARGVGQFYQNMYAAKERRETMGGEPFNPEDARHAAARVLADESHLEPNEVVVMINHDIENLESNIQALQKDLAGITQAFELQLGMGSLTETDISDWSMDINELKRRIPSYRESIDFLRKVIAEIEKDTAGPEGLRWQYRNEEVLGGALYNVDIRAEPTDFIDWDQRFEDMPRAHQEAILKVFEEIGFHQERRYVFNIDTNEEINVTGRPDLEKTLVERGYQATQATKGISERMQWRDIYAAITDHIEQQHPDLSENAAARKASDLMVKHGIPGWRYLDGTSRKSPANKFHDDDPDVERAVRRELSRAWDHEEEPSSGDPNQWETVKQRALSTLNSGIGTFEALIDNGGNVNDTATAGWKAKRTKLVDARNALQKYDYRPGWNYVVADESKLKTLTRNDQPVEDLMDEMGTGRAQGPLAFEPLRIPVPDTGQSGDEDTSLSQLGKNLIKLLGLVVKRGARSGRELGSYLAKTGVIRVRDPKDYSTLVHEAGHALHDSTVTNLDPLIQQHAAELTAVAQQYYKGFDQLTPAKKIREGFAEFFRGYMTRPDLDSKIAPAFHAAFENYLKTDHPDLLKALGDMRQQLQHFLRAQTSVSVLQSNMVSPDTSGTIGAAWRDVNENGLGAFLKRVFPTLAFRGYSEFINQFHAFARTKYIAQDLSVENFGQVFDLKVSEDPEWLLNKVGRSGQTAMVQMTSGVRAWKSDKILSGSYQAALAVAMGATPRSRNIPMTEARLNDFGVYLMAKTTLQEWLAREDPSHPKYQTQDPTSFSKDDCIQSIIDLEAKYGDSFKNGADMVYKFQQAYLQRMYEGGRLTEEQYQENVTKADYAPLLRQMSDRTGDAGSSGALGSGKSPLLKMRRGSTRDIINPVYSIMYKAIAYERLLAQDEVYRSLENLSIRGGAGMGELIETVPATRVEALVVKLNDAANAVFEALDQSGASSQDIEDMKAILEASYDANAQFKVFRRRTIEGAGGERLHFFYKAGKIAAIQIGGDQEHPLADAMNNALEVLGQKNLDPLIDFLAVPATIFRAGVTLRLDFMARNIVRDTTQTHFQQQGFIPVYHSLVGMFHELFQTATAQNYSLHAGMSGGMQTATLDAIKYQQDIRGLKKAGWLGKVVGYGNPLTPTGFAGALTRWGELWETGTRLGVFSVAYKRALKEGLNPFDAMEEASYKATDNMNFSQYGSRMQSFRKAVPFLGANIVGWDKMARTTLGNEALGRKGLQASLKLIFSPVRNRTIRQRTDLTRVEKNDIITARGMMLKLLIWIFAATALYKWIWDDDKLSEVNESQRANYWVFPGGFKIAKPQGYLIWFNLAERWIEAMRGDPSAWGRFGRSVWDASMPPMQSPLLKTGYELLLNKDTFTGQPIVPDYLKVHKDDPWMQYTEKTSELMKRLGEATNLSPLVLEHFLYGVAPLTQDIVPLFDMPLNPDRTEKGFEDSAGFRAFYYNSNRGSTATRDFWDIASKTNGDLYGAASGYKFYMDSTHPIDAQRYLESLKPDLRAFAILDYHFKADEKRMHPAYRVAQVAQITSKMTREMLTSAGLIDTTSKGEIGYVQLTAERKHEVQSALQELTMREQKNALIAMKIPGWAQKKPVPIEPTLALLAQISPEAADEYQRRHDKARIYDGDSVNSNWPELKQRLLSEGGEANLSDLVAMDQ